MKYRGYTIIHEPPPIPWRGADWSYWHEDYDGPGDDRHGTGASQLACMHEIDEMILDELDKASAEADRAIAKAVATYDNIAQLADGEKIFDEEDAAAQLADEKEIRERE